MVLIMGESRKFIILIVILSLVFSILDFPLVSAAEDSWTSMEPMPLAMSGIGVAVVNGKIYTMGSNYDNQNINEEYDPVTNTWTSKAPMPTPRSSFGIAVVENKIYTIGGDSGNWTTGRIITNINEIYDPATDTWETKTSMPTPRYALEAHLVNGKIYLIGGNSIVNEVYDPVTDSWTTKTPIPIGVGYYASAVVDNKIYIIGGAVGLSHNQIYDTETDTWSSGASLPTGVDSAAAGVTAGVTDTQRIFVIGGKENLDAVNLNQVYDPETNTWVAGPWLPTARYGLGVAVLNDSLYAIGGREGWFGSPISAANERYTPTDFIPEFPSWIILPLFLTVTLIGILVRKRLVRTRQKPLL
jgi:N-acetylneuraminic acid mutarotase